MRNKLKAALVGLVLLFSACGGGGQLASAHTSITAGCVVGADYAGTHNVVSALSLDSFEVSCRDALHQLEDWHQLATLDAGTEDGHDGN